MNREPTTDFDYPREPDTEGIEAARNAGRGESWRLLVELLSSARNRDLRVEALRYLSNPSERTVAQIAKQLGVSRITVHRELKAMKAFRFLSDVTPSTE